MLFGLGLVSGCLVTAMWCALQTPRSKAKWLRRHAAYAIYRGADPGISDRLIDALYKEFDA